MGVVEKEAVMTDGESVPTGKPFHDDDKLFLILCYAIIIPFIGFFLPVVPFIMFRDKRADPQKEFVYWHARQGLALDIVAFVLALVLWPVYFVLAFIPVVGWILSCLIAVAVFAGVILCCIMGWTKAFAGQKWEIPLISKLAEMFK